jgi:hypothetical protein
MCGRSQQFLWDIMERPHTSLAAKETIPNRTRNFNLLHTV